MKNHSTKFFMLSVVLLSFLGGCKKSQKADDKKQSHFSKTSHKNAATSSKLDPLELDKDSLKTFALDDSISKHQAATTAAASSASSIFAWDNIDSEKSRNLFKTLYFDFNVDTLKPKEDASLKYDIAEAKKMIKKDKTIVIEGHACHSEGSAAYNMAISERRARYVAQKFSENGIDAANIKIAPRGQEMPVRKNGSRKDQWVNRRVEIYAIDAK